MGQQGALATVLAVLLAIAAALPVQGSYPLSGRRLRQASAQASSAAIENLSGNVTATPASAAASSVATATSITPLPPQTTCIRFNNTNFAGFLLRFVFNVQDAGRCCDLCTRQPFCNVYVHCPPGRGCDDGSGRIYPGSLCTLKYQTLRAGTNAATYGAGPNVTWISGIVTQTSLGYCVGYAQAAASAQATAGCGSVAYAVAVATAVDNCGNKAAASALAVAVGGQCPVTCESAVADVKAATSSDGCNSGRYKDASATAAALCGASRYAELTAGVCPPPSCDAAVASAAASANAQGCASTAYSAALASAQAACGAQAFASATAAAIGAACPVDCAGAVKAATTAASRGCNSTEFLTAQGTAVVLCGADNYAAQAAAVPGGICTIGDVPPPPEEALTPAVEQISTIPGGLQPIIGPAPIAELLPALSPVSEAAIGAAALANAPVTEPLLLAVIPGAGGALAAPQAEPIASIITAPQLTAAPQAEAVVSPGSLLLRPTAAAAAAPVAETVQTRVPTTEAVISPLTAEAAVAGVAPPVRPALPPLPEVTPPRPPPPPPSTEPTTPPVTTIGAGTVRPPSGEAVRASPPPSPSAVVTAPPVTAPVPPPPPPPAPVSTPTPRPESK